MRRRPDEDLIEIPPLPTELRPRRPRSAPQTAAAQRAWLRQQDRVQQEWAHAVRTRRQCPGQELLLAALEYIDNTRSELRVAGAQLEALLVTGGDQLTPTELTALRATWRAFQAAGGVTGADFRSFLLGERASRTTPVIKMINRGVDRRRYNNCDGGPPDAA
jgi:hypothetical protein